MDLGCGRCRVRCRLRRGRCRHHQCALSLPVPAPGSRQVGWPRDRRPSAETSVGEDPSIASPRGCSPADRSRTSRTGSCPGDRSGTSRQGCCPGDRSKTSRTGCCPGDRSGTSPRCGWRQRRRSSTPPAYNRSVPSPTRRPRLAPTSASVSAHGPRPSPLPAGVLCMRRSSVTGFLDECSTSWSRRCARRRGPVACVAAVAPRCRGITSLASARCPQDRAVLRATCGAEWPVPVAGAP